MNGLFKSVNGDVSSKRVAGFILILSAIAFSGAGVATGNSLALEAAKPMLYSGVAALGVGVAERFGKGGTVK